MVPPRDMYYMKLTGQERDIPLALSHDNVLTATVSKDSFALGSDIRYRLSVVRKLDASRPTPVEQEIDIDIMFSTSIVTKLAIGGTIGTGILFLLIYLVQMMMTTNPEERRHILVEFVQFEMFLGAFAILRA